MCVLVLWAYLWNWSKKSLFHWESVPTLLSLLIFLIHSLVLAIDYLWKKYFSGFKPTILDTQVCFDCERVNVTLCVRYFRAKKDVTSLHGWNSKYTVTFSLQHLAIIEHIRCLLITKMARFTGRAFCCCCEEEGLRPFFDLSKAKSRFQVLRHFVFKRFLANF